MDIELYSIIAIIMILRKTNACKKLRKLKIDVKLLMKTPMNLMTMKESSEKVGRLNVESLLLKKERVSMLMTSQTKGLEFIKRKLKHYLQKTWIKQQKLKILKSFNINQTT